MGAPAVEDADWSAQESYFKLLRADLAPVLAVAERARALGYDPVRGVEVVVAEDLAARVEVQAQIPGIAARVRELTKLKPSREEVAFEVAREVARGKFVAFSTPEEAIEKAVRVGLSVVTEGVLVAPLEGVAEVRLGTNTDQSRYVDLYFAGPIRSAGGTEQGLAVVIADVVRKELGVGRYQPTQAEIERYKEEIPAYKRAQHLQYMPTSEEIETVVRNCPICINGEGTEKAEVTGHRNLPRVETNRLRGGAMLVLAEGVCQKASKLAKIVKALSIEGWSFLENVHAASPTTPGELGEDGAAEMGFDAVTGMPLDEVKSSDKYIRDLIGGRPIFAHPSRRGGFRLRYGRSPTAGLASTAMSPVTMHVLGGFLAVGTQMKLERPGKGTIATPCDALDGPTVLLRNGDLVRVETLADWKRVAKDVEEITDLGEILIPFGEFLENNQPLMEPSYVHEWWFEDLVAAAGAEAASPWRSRAPAYEDALRLAKEYGVPLHPDHTLLWHDLTPADYAVLRDHTLRTGTVEGDALTLAEDPQVEGFLVELNAWHRHVGGRIRIERLAACLRDALGLAAKDRLLTSRVEPKAAGGGRFPVLGMVRQAMGVTVKARAPSRIGARMGRPEKADARTMEPAVHAIYPVGFSSGAQRKVADALKSGAFKAVVGSRRCERCQQVGYLNRCRCGGGTDAVKEKPVERPIHLKEDLKIALERLAIPHAPDIVKGVQGLISAARVPESLEKGILRAKHGISVFKDGTARFDMTDAPLTHFRPRDIGTPVAKIVELGYPLDAQGKPLTSDDQLVELQEQDLVLARVGGDYLVKTSQFVDELLVKFYGLPAYYRAKRPEDLIGHLVAGLAPHTSAAVLGRIIGYTAAQVAWAHPYFHAAKRRNCDGDEDAVMLLLDCLLNFSKTLVPDKRGGLMDLPLVLSTRVNPSEIDDEAHNLDVGWAYPRAFYEAAERRLHPKEVAPLMDLVKNRLGTPAQFSGFGVTHTGTSIHRGAPAESSYKTLGTMLEKLEAQLALAEKLRAVDTVDVANRVISGHLLPDLLGNLKAFSRQKVRCTKCSASYRRIPLAGKCTNRVAKDRVCGNALTLTVHPKSVRKYLEIALDLSRRFELPIYTKQRIELAQKYIEESFAPEKFSTPSLTEFA